MVTLMKWLEIEQSLDAKTREKLIQEGSDLSLEKAIDRGRTDEMSKTQLETMASEDASINGLNQRKPKPEQTRKQKHDHTQKKEVPSKECHKCGYKHGNNKCYAKGKRCTKCQKLTHFARVCRSKSDARKGVYLLKKKIVMMSYFLDVLLQLTQQG